MIERYANVKIPLNIAFSRSSFDIKNTSIDKTMCKTMFISANYNFSIKRDERGGGCLGNHTLYRQKQYTNHLYPFVFYVACHRAPLENSEKIMVTVNTY